MSTNPNSSDVTLISLPKNLPRTYLEFQTISSDWMFGDFQPCPISQDLVHHPTETSGHQVHCSMP